MQSHLDTVKAFVEGRLAATEFGDLVNSDAGYGDLLMEEHGRPSQWVDGSTYLYLMRLDFDNPGHVSTARQLLSEWLDRCGVEHTCDDSADKRSELLHKAMPRWLNADLAFVERIAARCPEPEGPALVKWLREELTRTFRSLKRPPKWLQNPAWPIGENGPLVFVGQLSAGHLFHDETNIYVFVDAVTGETVVVRQSM